jgi:uncharacterized OB-fold protein
MAGQRPLPRLNDDNRAFWTGGAEGKLQILRCKDCGDFIHPPQPLCRKCLSENVAPEAVAGTGTVYSYSINHQKWHPGLEVPYVIARVELDGVPGVYLTTNIINCPVDSVDIGDRVKVTFEQQEEIYIPLFEKVG